MLNERELTQTTSALLKSCKLANAEELQQSNMKNVSEQVSALKAIPRTLNFSHLAQCFL